MKRFQISEAEYKAIEAAEKATKDKSCGPALLRILQARRRNQNMVPRHGQVVAHAVHNFDDFNALENDPDGQFCDKWQPVRTK